MIIKTIEIRVILHKHDFYLYEENSVNACTAFGKYTQLKLLTLILWGERDKEQVTCLPRRLKVYTVFTSRIFQFWKQPCVLLNL